MNRAFCAALCISTLSASLLHAQPRGQGRAQFDLSQIGFVLNGQQICEDKGRLQDYPSKVMDQIIAAGPKAVPVLIGMIADAREAKTNEPIICFWPGMAIGDIAFCTLSDLFSDSSQGKTTMPGAARDDLLGPAGNRPAWVQLDDYVKKHGRKALQAKWQRLWEQYAKDMSWDQKAKCFRLKGK